ncbi:MAG: glycosyltransferase family 2 protein [Phycisphaerales bacterium]
MSTRLTPNKPIEVRIPPTPGAAAPAGENGRVAEAGGTGARAGASVAAATATVCVIIVTWNRKKDVDNILRSLSRQDYPTGRMHVIVVDNSSTDGTLNVLSAAWKPEFVVENATDRAHEPRFEAARRLTPGEANAGGFGSLTLVRNHSNMGGCGGFNTGLSYVAHALASRGRAPEYAWLVDDDADVPSNALTELTKAAASDERIGLVGSRTVDMSNKRVTIESTIYLNREVGAMGDAPPVGHARHEYHAEWVKKVGGPRGENEYTGLRDVDVVSACSMLARWSAVEQVGFWDWRYFIYCDDADWCLRFGKAGYRVVLNLDAVVYHTPWNMKLTVARIYYSQRNMLWMLQKVLEKKPLRRAMRHRMWSILRDSLQASMHRRLFHAEVIRRTAMDVVVNRAGKLDRDGPAPEATIDAMRRAGVLSSGKRIAVLCSHPASVGWADQLRVMVNQGLDHAAGESMPRWTYVTRNDVPDHGGGNEPAATRPYRLIYAGHRLSRVRRQLRMLTQRPAMVVVFDQTTDYPACWGKWNLHLDSKRPGMGQLERDGVIAKAGFLGRWAWTALRCGWYAMRVKPRGASATRYG